jgi:hypothetical protein
MYYTKVCKLSTPFCATDISLNHSTTMLVLLFFFTVYKKKCIILNRKNIALWNQQYSGEKKKNRDYAASKLPFCPNIWNRFLWVFLHMSAYANVGGCLKVNTTICCLWCQTYGVQECEQNSIIHHTPQNEIKIKNKLVKKWTVGWKFSNELNLKLCLPCCHVRDSTHC